MEQQRPLNISMVIPGDIYDKGFMESGYNGLLNIKHELGANINYKDQIRFERQAMIEALEELAEERPDMLIMHGGQGAEATETVARKYPNIQFVVGQGYFKGSNLSSFDVLQEQSAFLAGAAAGLLTETNVIGHMSGIRVVPGMKGRAAFADGLKQTNSEAQLLTSFIGDQDDNTLSKKYAEAQIEKGADIIFTMLNAGRDGVTETLKNSGLKQIGNVRDYVDRDPDGFIASAVADSGMGSFLMVKNFLEGTYEPNVIKHIGLENKQVVRLSLSSEVPQSVKEKINELEEQVKNGDIIINLEYNGPEFTLET